MCVCTLMSSCHHMCGTVWICVWATQILREYLDSDQVILGLVMSTTAEGLIAHSNIRIYYTQPKGVLRINRIYQAWETCVPNLHFILGFWGGRLLWSSGAGHTHAVWRINSNAHIHTSYISNSKRYDCIIYSRKFVSPVERQLNGHNISKRCRPSSEAAPSHTHYV